jgi:hypothetical protein
MEGYERMKAGMRLYRTGSGASSLRDLAYTAWIESAKPIPRISPTDQQQNSDNPRYNPATGSAPAPLK